MYYTCMNYFSLGRVAPRDRIREPFQSELESKWGRSRRMIPVLFVPGGIPGGSGMNGETVLTGHWMITIKPIGQKF
jgi:hypothetical protein